MADARGSRIRHRGGRGERGGWEDPIQGDETETPGVMTGRAVGYAAGNTTARGPMDRRHMPAK